MYSTLHFYVKQVAYVQQVTSFRQVAYVQQVSYVKQVVYMKQVAYVQQVVYVNQVAYVQQDVKQIAYVQQVTSLQQVAYVQQVAYPLLIYDLCLYASVYGLLYENSADYSLHYRAVKREKWSRSNISNYAQH